MKHTKKQLTALLIATVALTLSSCDLINLKKSKSEEEIRREVELQIQHQQDSIRLVEAEARAQEAETRAQRSEEAARAASAAKSTPARTSTSYDWLSERYVTESDLYGLSSAERRILRNAIYARHCYKFKSADLINYFSQFAWYQPLYSNVESSLSTIERKNVQFIKARE